MPENYKLLVPATKTSKALKIAKHLATDLLTWSDGDVRVENDAIITIFYGNPNHINERDYVNLPEILKRKEK